MGTLPRSVVNSRTRKQRERHGGFSKKFLPALRWSAGALLLVLLPFTASCNLGELAVSLKAIARGLANDTAVARADLGVAPADEGSMALRSEIVSYLRRHHTGLSRLEEVMLAGGILRAAEESRTDYRLILAVIKVESRFSNWATSPKGALGLMQVMPATGRIMARELELPWAGGASLFDPVTNVQIGTSYFAKLRSRYGDVGTALMAYNRGPGALEAQAVIDPSSDEYVSRVMGTYHRLLQSSLLADARNFREVPAI